MSQRERIPEATTRRLSLYLRVLAELQEGGDSTASSGTIAGRLGLKSAQVRKDLSRFGGFGTRGVGYDVTALRGVIERILGLHRSSAAVIVGAGNLGSALGDYPGFNGGGFEIVALLDVDDAKVGGCTRLGRPIRHLDEMESLIRERGVSLAIVAVPVAAAQPVIDRLVSAGIPAILNFAPIRPTVPEHVALRSVDLKMELESLSFYLAQAGPTAAATDDDGRRE